MRAQTCCPTAHRRSGPCAGFRGQGLAELACLRKDLGGTRARWATADDGYADRAHRDSSAGDDRGRGSAEVEAESSSGEGQHHRGGDAVRGRGGRK
eukprot:scaffold4835_cov116-Isochrysis_galbana.AAC.2